MPRPLRNHPLIFLALALVFATSPAHAQAEAESEVITVDAHSPSHPFPHFWETMFGSGRAILSLRESYRRDLREVKQITGFQYLRFHGIFHDELGVYSEDSQGHAVYNFSYVDQIYDGLLANGVKPFVEISFMPAQLAARPILHSFWYKPNVSQPKDWQKWDDLVTAFTKHLIDRYGITEIASWYFEVWNEPNIDFWAGDPKQATYWQLYDHTARAVKKADVRLRVGGPATAQAAWVDVFIRHCAEKNVPLDFVSSHVYGNDSAQDVFGTNDDISQNKMVCRAVNKVHEQILASTMPGLPLIWSEFNASFKNETAVTDSVYMGPWLADMIRQCDGLTKAMSYWTFSDVFEEQGVVRTPFYGGYGLIAVGGIPKPAFQAFRLLHGLGNSRVMLDSNSALLTRKEDGSLVLAVWNYAPPGQTNSPKSITLTLKNTNSRQALIWRLDSDHGDVRTAYEQLGAPRYPTQLELQKLRAAAELPPPETVDVRNSVLSLRLPSPGLALVELK
jgi:xylan 1,4-beta-xylosidase